MADKRDYYEVCLLYTSQMVSCSIACRNFYRKHVVFLILLRRLLYSENLNSPTAQTVSLSLYAMLAKLRNPAYCLLAEISACNG